MKKQITPNQYRINPDQSWMHGKYIIDNHRVEINTQLPYVAIDGYRTNFFEQGEEAQKTIDQIHEHWLKSDCTVQDSIQWFINTYL